MTFKKGFFLLALWCLCISSICGMDSNSNGNGSSNSNNGAQLYQNLQQEMARFNKFLQDLRKYRMHYDEANTLRAYNALRALCNQAPAQNTDEIQYDWIEQIEYLVQIKALLESVNDKHGIQKLIKEINITVHCLLQNADLNPYQVNTWTKEALFKYNYLCQLFNGIQVSNIQYIDTNWLQQLSQQQNAPAQLQNNSNSNDDNHPAEQEQQHQVSLAKNIIAKNYAQWLSKAAAPIGTGLIAAIAVCIVADIFGCDPYWIGRMLRDTVQDLLEKINVNDHIVHCCITDATIIIPSYYLYNCLISLISSSNHSSKSDQKLLDKPNSSNQKQKDSYCIII